ncbi:O-demethylpuromycin-O-methyltransferase [Orbilia brochopaga]|nr:O-demethylpuromycin-O-methyltransferase [Drechslerella brochopaga]
MSSQAIKAIIDSIDKISPDLGFQARRQTIDALRQALDKLQTPFERVFNMILFEPLVLACFQIGTDLGLWEAWESAGGGKKSLDDLLKLCKKDCDVNLLRRVLRLMVGRKVIEEIGEDRYTATAFSLSMADSKLALTIQSGIHHWLNTAAHIPGWLAKTNYQEPQDAKNTVYIDLPQNTERLPYFDLCNAKPEYQASFTAWMSMYTEWKQNWTDIFDTKTLFEGCVLDSEAPIIVDIGGNDGVDMMRFLEKHPDVPRDSLVIQDQAHVIELVRPKIDSKVKLMPYDFFKQQPIIGSRAYLLKLVLHDWPDNLALQILQNLRPALKRGYSKLLICEVVIPAKGASIEQAMQDLLIMACLSAVDRTEAAWRKLLTQAGFKVARMWKDARGIDTVIEAELAD